MPKGPLQRLQESLPEPVGECLDTVNGFAMTKVFFVTDAPWWDCRTPPQQRANRMPTREVHYYLRPKDDESGEELGMAMVYTDRPATEYWNLYVVDPDDHAEPEIDKNDRLEDQFARFFSDEIEKAAESGEDPNKLVLNEFGRRLASLNAVDRVRAIADSVVTYGIRDWSRAPYDAANHSWRPGVRSGDVRRLFEAFDYGDGSANLHICGEAYSDYSGFIEGALRTVERVLCNVPPVPKLQHADPEFLVDAIGDDDDATRLHIAENVLQSEQILPLLQGPHDLDSHHLTYQKSIGDDDLRAATAAFLNRRFGLRHPLNRDQVACFSGARAVLGFLGREVFRGGSPASVLIPTPAWQGFTWVFEDRLDGCIVEVPLAWDDDYALDPSRLEDAYVNARHKPRALVLTLPDNPIGINRPRETLEAVAEWVLSKPGMHLIGDEIYAQCQHTGTEPAFCSVLDLRAATTCPDRIHSVWGWAKDLGLSGLRVGVLATRSATMLGAARSAEASLSPIPSSNAWLARSLWNSGSLPGRVDELMDELPERLTARHAAAVTALREEQIPLFEGSHAALFVWLDLRSWLGLAPPCPSEQPTVAALLAVGADPQEIDLSCYLVNEAKIRLLPGTTLRSREPGFFRLCHTAVDEAELLAAIRRMGEKLGALSASRSCLEGGPECFRSGDRYDDLRAVANQRFDLHPDRICLCRSETDVREVLASGVPEGGIRIRSGGHHHEGMCGANDALVIDLREMNEIRVGDDNVVTIGVGASLKSIYEAVQAHGLLFPGGGCADVALGGLVHGGGWGPFARHSGFTSDSIVSARMVTADGCIHDLQGDHELLWAIRGGGGGNFGVVTQLGFRLEPISYDELYRFHLQWKEEFAVAVIDRWRDTFPNHPDRSITSFGRVTAPDGDSPAMIIAGVARGSDCETIRGNLQALMGDLYGKAEEAEVKPWNPSLWLPSYQPGPPMAALRTAFPHLGDDRLQSTCDPELRLPHKVGSAFPTAGFDARALVDYVLGSSHDEQARRYVSLHGMGGAIAEGGPELGPIAFRDRPFLLQFQAWWLPGAVQHEYIEWVRHARDAMASFTEGAFINFVDRDLWEGDHPPMSFLRHHYADADLDRLMEIKMRYDRENRFGFELGIPPKDEVVERVARAREPADAE